jgi:hypothetical protein
MIRFFHIAVMFWLTALITSCNGQKQQNAKPVWEDVKLGDLAPTGQKPQIQRLDSINFQVNIFETPAENTGKLNEISKTLYTQPFRFKHFKAFGANSFSVGFGRTSLGNQIFDMLSEAGAKRVGSSVILLSDGRYDDLPVNRLFNRTSIYYTSTDGSIKTKSIGPGQLALRIKAQKIPGLRGVCNVSFTPVSPSPLKQLTTKSSDSSESNDTFFESCSFSLKMSPGDFIYLRPLQYISHQNSLGSFFFSRAAARPYVVSFLIICTQISD